MSILDDLEAFLQEHRHCGELRSGTWEARVIHGVVDCSCGGYVAKPINSADEDDGRRRRPSWADSVGVVCWSWSCWRYEDTRP